MKIIRLFIAVLYIFGCISTSSSDCEKVYYKDFDRDRFSDGVTSCTQEPGFFPPEELISTFGDCDDSNNMVYPDSPTQACPQR